MDDFRLIYTDLRNTRTTAENSTYHLIRIERSTLSLFWSTLWTEMWIQSRSFFSIYLFGGNIIYILPFKNSLRGRGFSMLLNQITNSWIRKKNRKVQFIFWTTGFDSLLYHFIHTYWQFVPFKKKRFECLKIVCRKKSHYRHYRKNINTNPASIVWWVYTLFVQRREKINFFYLHMRTTNRKA